MEKRGKKFQYNLLTFDVIPVYEPACRAVSEKQCTTVLEHQCKESLLQQTLK